MMREIYNNGPIAVALNASPDLYYYSSGVFITNPQNRLSKAKQKIPIKPLSFKFPANYLTIRTIKRPSRRPSLGIHKPRRFLCGLGGTRTLRRNSQILDFEEFLGERVGREGLFQNA
jgi:hypothetical protein